MSDQFDLVFAPVTREQARLFGRIADLLDRRGMRCGFAAPSSQVVADLRDAWGSYVRTAEGSNESVNTRVSDLPECIGAYDVWRGIQSEEDRVVAARSALSFWQNYVSTQKAKALVVWNGRDHVFVESAVHIARQSDIEIIFMELGPMRRNPMTVAISRGGINAAALFRRQDMFGRPLTPWEAARLDAVRVGFRAGVRSHRRANPYAFLPLQVDDDTQLFYYAPHFSDQPAMVAAVVDAMPDDLSLVVKIHPLCDPRNATDRYAELLRPCDRITRTSDTLGLIARSEFVVTNNSSAGIEALMLERLIVVLGDAHYGKRGFSQDLTTGADLRELICAARYDAPNEEARTVRDRYLYELLFHELVHLERHPLTDAPTPEESERLAVRICDLIKPMQLGSDWQPLFNEIHELRRMLQESIERAIGPRDGDRLVLVATRFAAASLGEVPGTVTLELEALFADASDQVAGRDVWLLAPDLSAGQRASAASRLRSIGAADVRDLAGEMSRQPCWFHVNRFNRLPRAMRDELYRTSDYWDYYLTQSGIPPENTPEKAAQCETLVDQLRSLAPESILEYGCGDGRILQALLTAENPPWKRVVGADASERMLQLAGARLADYPGVTLLPADARSALAVDDRSFDAVLTCGVLAHVPAEELAVVLGELHRVARCWMIHWEVFEAHRAPEVEHYTNANASRAIHALTFDRFGPVAAEVRDARPLTGQDSLLACYDLTRPLITVLTLHAAGTPDRACTSHDYRNMFVSPEQLIEIVDGLREAGYRFMALSEALDVAMGRAPACHKCVVLTFDDGYASVFEEALPILASRDIRAAAFIPAGFIGRTFGGNTREGNGPALAMMTPQQIRELHAAGWDIGAHSVSHRAFSGLTGEDAARELADAKADIESIIRDPVRFFAFPYGEPRIAYRAEHVEMARSAGYELALTMKPGFVPIGFDGLDWPRIGVGIDDDMHSLRDSMTSLHRRMSGWPVREETGASLETRVRNAVRRCVDAGVKRVALYGAGRHTARMMQSTPLWPLDVVGIVDDDCSLQGAKRYGLPIHTPSEIRKLPIDAVIISSDRFEAEIYRRISPLESEGIKVLRLYEETAAD